MKQLLMVAVVACVMGFAGAALAGATPKSDFGKLKSDVRNEEAIRKLYEQFTAAWNKHDTRAMANMWAEDGDQVDPDGHEAKGRAEIAKVLALQHDTVFKTTHIAFTIDTVWFITADVALIDGAYDLTGATDPDGKALPDRKGHLTSIFMLEGGKWWIAASRLMIPVSLPWKKQ